MNEELDYLKERAEKMTRLIVMSMLLLLAFLLGQKCSCSKERAVQVVKEQKGKFESVKPVSIKITQRPVFEKSSTTNRKLQTVWRNMSKNDLSNFDKELINKLQLQNQQLTEKYKQASDSLRLAMFEEAKELKIFNQTFENEQIKIDVGGVSSGTVEQLGVDYTIKEQRIPVKQRVFAFKLGAEYGNTTQLNAPVLKVNLGAEFKKFAVRYGYDNSSRHYLGIETNLFEIKR